MIEATCAACGTLNRIAEGEVPQGARFVTCSSCKARIPLPGKATVSGVSGSAKPPAIPAIPAPGAKSPPPIPSAKPTMDIADLPAPKRPAALAGVGDPKPAPKSALSDVARTASKSAFADLEVDLPAPKVVPRPPTGAELDDLGPMSPVTMPAAEPPKGEPTNIALGKSGARGVHGDISDLPAPKARALPSIKAVNPLDAKTEPAGAATSLDLEPDLLAPKAKAAPRAPAPQPPPVAPVASPAALANEPDLLAPKVGPSAARTATKPVAPDAKTTPLDLPAPKRPSTPAAAAATMPAPGAPPAPSTQEPKGFFDDLPAPVGPSSQKPDLLAPKGFFDDLPHATAPDTTPGIPDLPAPKGFFDDLPQSAGAAKQGERGPDLPAPKGFFDDLPQSAGAAKQGARGPDLPAPKGFFDDLPQSAGAAKQAGKGPDLPAPKGFFEDLPQPARGGGPELPAPKGFDQNLPQPKGPGAQLPQPAMRHGGDDMDLQSASGHELELQGPSPELDLGLPVPEKPAEKFGDLDLSEPSAKGGIRFEKAKQTLKPAETPPTTPFVGKKGGGDVELQLADELPGQQKATAAVAARKTAKPKLDEAQQAQLAARRKKRTRIALATTLFVVLGGAGGFMFYQRRVAAQERAERISQQVEKARKAIVAPDAQHWQRAITAAKGALADDATNADALGIGAEASIAAALENGVNFAVMIQQGHKWVQTANGKSLNTPALQRARAVDDIAQNHPDLAVAKLNPLVAANPKDAYLQLYFGWALLQNGDAAKAVKAFDAASANEGAKLAALYGRGQAKLVTGDLNGARTDFSAVLEAQKDHIPAMVGLAAALPPTQTQQRETDLLALLARKDISNADPRAVTRALTLAADVARSGGRLDVARDRYRKALDKTSNDVPALTGLAATELRDGKLEAALEQITKALNQSKDDPDAQLVAAEISIRQGKLKDAEDRLLSLAGRQPPLPPVQEARVHMLKGRLADARGKDDQALDEYIAGAKAAGELDLAPTMAAVKKLGEMATAQPDKAAEYRARADELLQSHVARAEEDPQLSFSLGTAYLEAGDPAKAEGFLRRAVEMRSTDLDSKLALAKALSKLGRVDEAIEQLRGALAIDGTRIDVNVELARTYELAGREADARQAYDTLLSSPDVPVAARAYAGRFFARTGDVKKAVLQAEPILKAEPDNAAGHYLKGEKLMLEDKLDEARRELAVATDHDPDPYYYDAAGRASELSLAETKELKFVDQAIRNYDLAHKGLATLFNPLAGLGRMYLVKKDYTKALEALLDANKLKGDDKEVTFEIGLCYKTLGALEQRQAAIKWLLEAKKLDEKRAEISFLLGELWADSDINKPALAAGAYTSATILAADEQKKTGAAAPDWLSEAYYKLGDLEYGLGHMPAAKRAFQSYVDSSPANVDHLKDARHKLNYELKTY
jgi:tetratricopeptide (TPR) repeat protein